jgi:hypothetical protein
VIRAPFLAAILVALPATADEAVRNWFKDPYFQVRAGFPRCTEPLGPYATEEQMLKETHYRSERGTRCWLEGKCSKPSSYMYDADIAQAVRARFDASAKLRDATLWITVQRRFVWIEGCIHSARDEKDIDAIMKDVPDVERVITFLARDASAAPPYRTLAAGQRRVVQP